MPSKNLERLSLTMVDKALPSNAGMRERIKMNSDWRFYPDEWEGEKPVGSDFDDGTWERVHLPHDFAIGGSKGPVSPTDQDFQPPTSGWYRKTFEIPNSDKGKNLWIDFDGICGKSTFWVNGRVLGNSASFHTGIHFDITDFVDYGEKNVLTIYVDANLGEQQWYTRSGIYRHVWLNKSDYLCVAPLGTFVISTIPDGETSPVEAEIEIQIKVLNGFQNALSFTVISEINDAQGKTVLSFSGSYTIGINTFTDIVQKVKLLQPILWSLENPHLYQLVTRLEREGEIVDGVTTSFGVRSIRFDENKGFFLNGLSLKIKGTCNHQDFAGIGIALPDSMVAYRLEKLIEMGSNACRSSFHPASVEFLNECDRLGLLVIDEQPQLDESEEIIAQVENMVLRDRNHPCVILWSLCHENQKLGMEETRRIGEVMKDAVLRCDITRPITCAMSYDDGAGLTKIIDVQGIDYSVSEYDHQHSSHPHLPLYGSAEACAVSTRGIYENDPEKGYLSAYDVNHPEWGNRAETAWKVVAERPFVFGGFVWTGFDYRGDILSLEKLSPHFQSGAMDICGFPKDAYFYYQSWWSNKKILHLFPHWNWKEKEGQDIDVWCYSNCETVELLLNEKSQGVQKMPRNGHLEWKVKYHPGCLRAVGIQSDKSVIEAVVETTSAPVKVRIKPYRLEMLADGEDMIPVEVEILDWKNRLVPLAYNEVVFSLKGPGKIAGVGNGDPDSHEPDKSDRRRAFNGRCVILVQALQQPGEIKLTAKAAGLRHGSVVLKSFKVD